MIMAGMAVVMTSCEKDFVSEIEEVDNTTFSETATTNQQESETVLLKSSKGTNYGVSFNQKVEEDDVPICIIELIAENYPNVIIEEVEAFIEEITNVTFYEIDLADANDIDFEIYCLNSPGECIELIETDVQFISENCLITTTCGDEVVVSDNFSINIQSVNGVTTYEIQNGEEKITFNCDVAGYDVECENADYFEDLDDFENLGDFELPDFPDFDFPELPNFDLPVSNIVTACGDSITLATGDLFDLDFDGDNFVFSLTHINGEVTEIVCEFGEYDIDIDKPEFDFDFDLDSLDFDFDDIDLGGIDLDGIDWQNGGDGIITGNGAAAGGEKCVFTTPCGDEIVFDNSVDFEFEYSNGTYSYILTGENGAVTSITCDKPGYEVECD